MGLAVSAHLSGALFSQPFLYLPPLPYLFLCSHLLNSTSMSLFHSLSLVLLFLGLHPTP